MNNFSLVKAVIGILLIVTGLSLNTANDNSGSAKAQCSMSAPRAASCSFSTAVRQAPISCHNPQGVTAPAPPASAAPIESAQATASPPTSLPQPSVKAAVPADTAIMVETPRGAVEAAICPNCGLPITEASPKYAQTYGVASVADTEQLAFGSWRYRPQRVFSGGRRGLFPRLHANRMARQAGRSAEHFSSMCSVAPVQDSYGNAYVSYSAPSYYSTYRGRAVCTNCM